MRALVLAATFFAATFFAGDAVPAAADTLVATRPGLMCRSATALATLTLPDGSSRAAGPAAQPGDAATLEGGGCRDLVAGARLALVTARHNTSIVRFDPGGGAQVFYVPNVDMRREAGGGDAAGATFDQLMAKHCPQQGWDRAVWAAYEGPLDEADRVLTPAERKAEAAEAQATCGPMGMACPDATHVGFLLDHGHADAVIRAFCAAKPDRVP